MYPNGKLPVSQITHVDGVPFWVGTANALKKAQHAAAASGHKITPINGYSGYRSLWLQNDGIDHPGKYDVTPGIRQLPAGHQTHGGGEEGYAIDTIDGYAWMLEHGAKYGFHHDIPGDRWHFGHDGKTAIHSDDTASTGGTTPAKPPAPKFDEELENMDRYYVEAVGKVTRRDFLVDWNRRERYEITKERENNTKFWQSWVANGPVPKAVSQNWIDVVIPQSWAQPVYTPKP